MIGFRGKKVVVEIFVIEGSIATIRDTRYQPIDRLPSKIGDAIPLLWRDQVTGEKFLMEYQC